MLNRAVFTYNYKGGTQKIYLGEIAVACGSDFVDGSPPMRYPDGITKNGGHLFVREWVAAVRFNLFRTCYFESTFLLHVSLQLKKAKQICILAVREYTAFFICRCIGVGVIAF